MFLSVALGTYNGAAFLSEQLQSIAAQERLPDELVVCDDASTDATVELISRFAAAAPFPVRWEVNPTNVGTGANFARAIGLCRGTWIALCDQDDIWRADKLRRLGEAAEQDPAVGLVFSDAELIDAQGRCLGERLWQAVRFSPAQQRQMLSGGELDVLLKHNVVTGATMLFRAEYRELVLPIGDGWVHDGWIALLVAAVSRCTALAEPLVSYRQHAQQQIGQRQRSLYQQYLHGKGKPPAYFQAVAAAFQAAHGRLARCSSRLRQARTLALLQRKAGHYRAKAAMRRPRHRRLPLVLRELLRGHYARYSSGWRSLAQDLFL